MIPKQFSRWFSNYSQAILEWFLNDFQDSQAVPKWFSWFLSDSQVILEWLFWFLNNSQMILKILEQFPWFSRILKQILMILKWFSTDSWTIINDSQWLLNDSQVIINPHMILECFSSNSQWFLSNFCHSQVIFEQFSSESWAILNWSSDSSVTHMGKWYSLRIT